MEFHYPAIRSKQTTSNKWLTQFSASAPEIDLWAGVPQKKRFGTGQETAGFQREENATRIKSLCDFYMDQENLIQNPLLCSLRSIPIASVDFVPDHENESQENVQIGKLVVRVPDYDKLSFQEILSYVREYIEDRVPSLKDQRPDDTLLNKLRMNAAEVPEFSLDVQSLEVSDLDNDDDSVEEDVEAASDSEVSSVLFEESHIIDFWQEIAARHEVSKQIEEPITEDSFLGFTRESLLSYLRPIVLVDGQHRLRGAMAAAKERLGAPELKAEIEERISKNENWKDVEETLIRRESRLLPVSLLMNSEPAEQVFQFVVVNQKATPIGRALLGTIISTTLSNEEMESVANRLKNAGIQLEESQAITYLARYPDSPFFELVERGLSGDNTDLLQWNVFASLIGIFRNLKGGRLFHEKRADYASKWATKFLPDSQIVSSYEAHGCETQFEYWAKLDGPWREVFIAFWTNVRDTLGNTEDSGSDAYWGKTRSSNLFNKVSLTILAADFFQFLVETRTTLNSKDDIPDLVEKWLEEVNKTYFSRNWGLAGSGTKKDSLGIRRQWSALWSEYRKAGGPLPDKRLYKQSKSE